MELNHQTRLCRPFPFLFGFRAILKTIGNITATVRALERLFRETACGG
jgi:hypothetical protein